MRKGRGGILRRFFGKDFPFFSLAFTLRAPTEELIIFRTGIDRGLGGLRLRTALTRAQARAALRMLNPTLLAVEQRLAPRVIMSPSRPGKVATSSVAVSVARKARRNIARYPWLIR